MSTLKVINGTISGYGAIGIFTNTSLSALETQVTATDTQYSFSGARYLCVFPPSGNTFTASISATDRGFYWTSTSTGTDTYLDMALDNVNGCVYYRTGAASRNYTIDLSKFPTFGTNPKVIISGSISNATCNYANEEIYDSGKQIIITANEGYEFSGVYNYKYNNSTRTVTSIDGTTLIFELPTDPTTDIELYDTYTATEKPIVSVGNFSIIYFPTEDILNQLSKSRFYERSDGVAVDRGESIISLFYIPFDVSGIKATEQKNIILGNYDTNILSDYSLSWILTISGGSIVIPYVYNNVFDFMNTECVLYVPFFDRVTLDNKYCIGQTLRVEYNINMYTGYTTLEIYTTLNNEICYTETRQTCYNMPFYFHNLGSVISEISIPKIETTLECYAEVTRNIPIENTGIFGKQREFYTQLSNMKGWQIVSDVNLDNSIPQEIQAEIKQILSGGVFV